MENRKKKFVAVLAVSFLLALTSVYPVISAYAQETKGKEVREIKEQKPPVKQEGEIRKQKNPYADAEITIQIISSANQTFGYDIQVNKRPLIHQPNIPCLTGNEGFKSKEKAQKVAEFVVKKIRKNEMPPTVTMEDLKSMDALK